MSGLAAAAGLLACPVCGAALDVAGRPVVCPAGHSFDVARQGYLNLLGGAQPANADSPAMVAAREAFLGAGLYEPIAADVARRLRHAGPLAEIGAGTGYYLARALGDRDDARGVALDVSTAAARHAARAHPRLAAVVADAWRPLPLRTGRFGGVLSVFAPRNLPEFHRVLGDGGLLVVVTPTADHLAALRARHGLLGIEDDKDARLRRAACGLFEAVATQRLDYTRTAGAEQVRDLIAMGPNAFHGVPAQVEAAEVRVSVQVALFRKLAGPAAPAG